MLFAIILSFASYSYAIAGTIITTSDAKSRSVELSDLETEIAELEVHYFTLMNGISLQDAENLGLTESSEIAYVNLENTTKVAYNF